ncbi:helix-turn-helix domain-containing protein [Azospirillum sp. RWY-5-1]|uniref:Helix-turn-helix domain-containing protein n=1 Tax=Azospirillum oleiclasticum TaxID=2735135 RepID=A0ABX2TFF1_9PROT|nr:cyclic nucleotide-binding domain-containing protein [Azospirillum oleiclasticum]NYZ17219.1 helix-turn-helix domain-containing protein [Azospirillum oleiclasticum]NYZ23072.1 helix-turn-helix domain-containing protein [Azospirillum oleiclasticum]
MDPRSILALPMFEGVPAAPVLRLLDGASVEMHPPRTVLFDAGATADAFHILLNGRVKLFALTADGKESVVEIIRPVSSFAEAAMFASGVYPVGAETIEPCDLVRVRASGFLDGLRANPDLARRILAALFRWNRRLDRELRMIKETPPIRRVVDYLLELAPDGEGGAVFELPLKKTVIASRLGMEPESLSRVLARLREVGVQSRGRVVEIADLGLLRRFDAGAAAAER